MQLLQAGCGQIAGQIVACKNSIGRAVLPKSVQMRVGVVTNDQIQVCVKRIAALSFLQRATFAMSAGMATLLPFKISLTCFPQILQTPIAFARPVALAGSFGTAVTAFCNKSTISTRLLFGMIATAVTFAVIIVAPAGIASVVRMFTPTWLLAAAITAFATSVLMNIAKHAAAQTIANQNGNMPAAVKKALE